MAWFSSFYEGTPMTVERLTKQYWVDNMGNTVRFAGAIAEAVQQNGAFDMAIEVGPNPALKGPATATMDGFRTEGSTLYTGLLSRGQNDIEQLSAALEFTLLERYALIEITLRTIPKFLLPLLLHFSLLSFAFILHFPEYYLWRIK